VSSTPASVSSVDYESSAGQSSQISTGQENQLRSIENSGVATATMPPPSPSAARTSVGKERPVGIMILLYIVTLGIYSLFWAYAVNDELKSATGRGMSGVGALLLWFFLSPVAFFIFPYEIEKAYSLQGKYSPVRSTTGLWFLLPLLGTIVWFVKVQSALNRFWVESGK
jgi:hypothetical protein